MSALGVHGKPPFFHAALLGKELADAPQCRCSEDAEERRQVDVGCEQCCHYAADAYEHVDPPCLYAPPVFGFDDDGVPQSYGEECHDGNDDACEVYHFVFFLFALSDCKGTTFFLIPAFLGRIIVILTVRFIDVYPRFAAKRIPFCGKTRSILRQNAFHFAAKRVPFCGKTHFVIA